MSGDRLDTDLTILEYSDAAELAKIWSGHLKDRVPDHLPKSLLYRLLAYSLQVEQRGGLTKNNVSYLKAIEDDLKANRKPETPCVQFRQPKVGSQLVREYEGTFHQVIVLDGSYGWNGKTFLSLSAVAKAITGTNWNGPRFFGVKSKSKVGASA
ncbi:MAG TPA: DUF2924 domain-containing protein [Aestuariivirga sp.]|nr:DUF2924 domain-containing protein [Aestuariivirga sp.]